jgi:hypothetical protein
MPKHYKGVKPMLHPFWFFAAGKLHYAHIHYVHVGA